MCGLSGVRQLIGKAIGGFIKWLVNIPGVENAKIEDAIVVCRSGTGGRV